MDIVAALSGPLPNNGCGVINVHEIEWRSAKDRNCSFAAYIATSLNVNKPLDEANHSVVVAWNTPRYLPVNRDYVKALEWNTIVPVRFVAGSPIFHDIEAAFN